jgi:hypothetical protein
MDTDNIAKILKNVKDIGWLLLYHKIAERDTSHLQGKADSTTIFLGELTSTFPEDENQ